MAENILKMYLNDVLNAAHKHSSLHIEEIRNSKFCGCFYCLVTFEPTDIIEWADDNRTAMCPNCGIDSVIGDKSGFPIHDKIFLKAMHDHWFQKW